MFGWLTHAPSEELSYQAWWAHDRMQERDALIEFIDYVVDRRRRFPDLHIYHYAAYETTALKRLTSRYEVCQDELSQLLSAGVFVDLYAVVHDAVRISQRSYSLKALEPIYMSERRVDLDNAGESIAMYAEATRLHGIGCDEQAEELLRQIERYNTYDVHSTLALRDWLLAQRS